MSTGISFEWDGTAYYYSKASHRIFKGPEVALPARRPPTNRRFAVRSIWLNISAGCNLLCDYCFNPPPAPDGSDLMTRQTARQAVIMLARLWERGPRQDPPLVIFFGGEPLLNRDVLTHTIHFSREWTRETGVPFRYSISTNATLLTPIDIALFSRERVLVQVSIDGPEPVHDYHRKFRGGSGSFSRALENAHLLAANSSAPVTVRATAAAGTCQLSRTLRFLVDQGFKSINIRVMEDNSHSGAAPGEWDARSLEEDANATVAELLRARERGVRCEPYGEQISSLRTGNYRSFVCGAGAAALCVSPDGWVYPCHRFQGRSDYRVGRVSEELDLGLCEKFASLDSSSIAACRDCWAAPLCWGCCPGESVAAELPLGEPNLAGCTARKLEALIALKYAAARGMALTA